MKYLLQHIKTDFKPSPFLTQSSVETQYKTTSHSMGRPCCCSPLTQHASYMAKQLSQSQTLHFFRGSLTATFSAGDWLSLKSAAQELSRALRSSTVLSEVDVWMDWDTLCTSFGRCCIQKKRKLSTECEGETQSNQDTIQATNFPAPHPKLPPSQQKQ